MTTLDLPTYVSISEAVKRYKLGREVLARLVETGKVRAVEVDGDVAVAEEDVNAASSSEVPSYIPISEAADRYNLDRDTLTRLVEAGRVRAVRVDRRMAVAEEDVAAASTKATIQAIQFDRKLEGQPIRVTEAAEKYGVSHANLSRWADTGYIRIIERAPRRLLLDEADVKYAAEVFKQARESTGSYVRAGWMLKRVLEQQII